MTEEEIARFAPALKEAERVAAEVAREAAYANEEGDRTARVGLLAEGPPIGAEPVLAA